MTRLSVVNRADNTPHTAANDIAADFYSMLAIKTINELNNGLPEELSCLNFDYDLLTQKI